MPNTQAVLDACGGTILLRHYAVFFFNLICILIGFVRHQVFGTPNTKLYLLVLRVGNSLDVYLHENDTDGEIKSPR